MSALIDRTGQVVGRLTVVRRSGYIGRYTAWLCRCECGGKIRLRSNALLGDHTLSCGCLRSVRAEERKERKAAERAARKAANPHPRRKIQIPEDVAAMPVSRSRKLQIARERMGWCLACRKPPVEGRVYCADHQNPTATRQDRRARTDKEIDLALAVLRKQVRPKDVAAKMKIDSGNIYPWLIKCVKQALETGVLVEA